MCPGAAQRPRVVPKMAQRRCLSQLSARADCSSARNLGSGDRRLRPQIGDKAVGLFRPIKPRLPRRRALHVAGELINGHCNLNGHNCLSRFHAWAQFVTLVTCHEYA